MFALSVSLAADSSPKGRAERPDESIPVRMEQASHAKRKVRQRHYRLTLASPIPTFTAAISLYSSAFCHSEGACDRRISKVRTVSSPSVGLRCFASLNMTEGGGSRVIATLSWPPLTRGLSRYYRDWGRAYFLSLRFRFRSTAEAKR